MREAVEGARLQARLGTILSAGTPAERTMAAYLLENIAELPFETAASLAAKIRVSEISIGRLCRTLGYRNLKDMKEVLKAEADLQAIEAIGDSPWLRGSALAERFAPGEARLREAGQVALEREIRAVMRNHELAAGADFARCVARLARAGQVRVAGFQTERGLAQYLAHSLSYLRPHVSALELGGGHFAEVFLDEPSDTALVLIEIRRYSQLAFALAEKAKAAGIPVTVITDPYCGWAHALADEVLRVETDFNHFWDASGQIAGLINLLVNAVFLELGPDVEDRLDKIAQNYKEFVGHRK